MKNIKKRRVVITGASGFIGSFLVNKLLSLGYENIITINRKAIDLKKTKNIKGNFSDEALLQEILKKNDIVIHLACSSNPSISQQNIRKDIEENMIGSVTLLQVCVDKKINKFIYISSGGVIYGNHGMKKVKEDARTVPINSHGIMKLSIENYLKVLNRLYNLNYIIIRPSNPYGRKNNDNKNQGIIDVFLKKVNNNEGLEIWGDGKIVRDFIYIEDLIALIIKTINPKIKNETFNAGSGIGTSVNDILKMIKKITGKNINVKYLKKRNFDVAYNVLNIKKSETLLNWKPKNNLEKNMRKILRKYYL